MKPESEEDVKWAYPEDSGESSPSHCPHTGFSRKECPLCLVNTAAFVLPPSAFRRFRPWLYTIVVGLSSLLTLAASLYLWLKP